MASGSATKRDCPPLFTRISTTLLLSLFAELIVHNIFRFGHTVAENNQLSELGQKIFLDRYAMKDMSKRTLSTGDMVIVCVDSKTGQREIGVISRLDPEAAGGAGRVTVTLKDGTEIDCLTEHVSKPIETVPERETARRLGVRIAIVGDPKQHSTRDLLARLRTLSHA